METLMTLEIKAKISPREVANQFLMIPIERRVPMVERIIKMKTVRDFKYFLKHSITNLTKSELTRDEIGIILKEIREFEKTLYGKIKKLRDEANPA